MSARSTQEISEEERRYEDGQDPKVLDVVMIEMISAQPQHHQRENHIIDPNKYWTRTGSVSWRDARNAVDDLDGPLWINGYSSSSGQHDRIPESQAHRLERSLYLVRPDGLTITVGPEGGGFSPRRRRVRASFDLCDYSYGLVVTDPWIEQRYLAKDDGQYALKDALVCVSLTETFHSYAYKLAAAIITRERAES